MSLLCHGHTASLLCEQKELQRMTGDTLRPGGLELTNRAMQFCNLPAHSTVLDVGCGYGQTMALLSAQFGLHVMGLDPAESMLRKTAELLPASLIFQADAAAIPVRSNFFDALIAECVLSLLADMQASLEEMHRVLVQGGRLVLTDIYARKENFLPGVPQSGIHSCFNGAVSIDTIRECLQAAGFTILLLEDHTRFLRQLAGQIIFSFGSLEAFWQLFMGVDKAATTCGSIANAKPGYYLLIAAKE
ncbi:MAG: methyltransferase domain-containing protein [Proteobacteria bacterium]|nr:methyltransferase domain-containing protein [Pseudomonadota bacterium]MBU1140647.1 methyltransferase domain-containing protein [Pseudomonadota bacterium]MBU1232335.1 methyltransferase domain-containing protein [Pseudomonadota bacterium]MBU1417229.1 methyltransferase domain-containing protein [Pseudomonadota bacterium]MBU1455996.1 methyltransferase domain-containing protein [Pseudomonadota bacterium]